MSIEAIKKALEGVNAAFLRVLAEAPADAAHYSIGLDLEDTAIRITLEDMRAISAAVPEIDRLQRENAALREDRYKLACAITGGEDAPGLLDSTPTSEIVEIAQHARQMHQDDIDRAEAAEAEVKRLKAELALSKPLYSRRQIEARVKLLEAALKPFAKFGGELAELKQRVFLQILVCPEGDDHADNYRSNFVRARDALASTGGEHHGN